MKRQALTEAADFNWTIVRAAVNYDPLTVSPTLVNTNFKLLSPNEINTSTGKEHLNLQQEKLLYLMTISRLIY